jgi:hypothetical protein
MEENRMNYRIVEENRQIWIEEHNGKKWVVTDEPNVPRYHPTVDDARSWVKTIKKGVVYHDAEDIMDGLQWFLDRVGKTVVRDGLSFEVMDDDYARHLHTASVEMGYIYTDPPNIAQDERKAEKGIGLSPEDRALIFARDIRC